MTGAADARERPASASLRERMSDPQRRDRVALRGAAILGSATTPRSGRLMSFSPSVCRASSRRPPSPSTTKAAELKAAGGDVIGSAPASPISTPPAHIQEAAIAAMRRGETRYYRGRRARPCSSRRSCASSSARTGSTTSPTRSPSAPAASRCSTTRLMATLDAGDEVVVPAPYWVFLSRQSWRSATRRRSPSMPSEQRLQAPPRGSRPAITPRTKGSSSTRVEPDRGRLHGG